MKFAMVGRARSEASPGVRGSCPCCGAETVSKCGSHVAWHWAHKARPPCDPWWEPETDWHRSWKDRFPLEWQETVLQDGATGERHIADVRTAAGLVIEFQRSGIHPDEVRAREAFYGRMVWVVDGCRNDFDRYNFSSMRARPDESGMAAFSWHGRSKLFARWHTTKPVFVDFGSEHGFWRVARFDPKSRSGLAMLVSVQGFVSLASSGTTDFSQGGGPASA